MYLGLRRGRTRVCERPDETQSEKHRRAPLNGARGGECDDELRSGGSATTASADETSGAKEREGAGRGNLKDLGIGTEEDVSA